VVCEHVCRRSVSFGSDASLVKTLVFESHAPTSAQERRFYDEMTCSLCPRHRQQLMSTDAGGFPLSKPRPPTSR